MSKTVKVCDSSKQIKMIIVEQYMMIKARVDSLPVDSVILYADADSMVVHVPKFKAIKCK